MTNLKISLQKYLNLEKKFIVSLLISKDASFEEIKIWLNIGRKVTCWIVQLLQVDEVRNEGFIEPKIFS
jgi:hypothetical protein